MSDGLNNARALRIYEIYTDFRALLHHLVQLQTTSTAAEYSLQGYILLRQCVQEAQAILQAPFNGAAATAPGNSEQSRQQLQAIIIDAAARRFRCQRAYLRSHAGIRWRDTRTTILQGQAPNQSHAAALQQADARLMAELLAITDAYVDNTLRAQDAAEGKWLNDDPSLAQIQTILASNQ